MPGKWLAEKAVTSVHANCYYCCHTHRLSPHQCPSFLLYRVVLSSWTLCMLSLCLLHPANSCLAFRTQTLVSAGNYFDYVPALQDGHPSYMLSSFLVTQLCPTLCNPMDCSPSGSSIYGIFQARILEWVAMSFSRGSSQPRDWTWVSHIVGRHFTIWAMSLPES